MNLPRRPETSACLRSPIASPVLPVPGSPMKTIFSALSRKARDARPMIWDLLTAGCRSKGKEARVQGQGILPCLTR